VISSSFYDVSKWKKFCACAYWGKPASFFGILKLPLYRHFYNVLLMVHAFQHDSMLSPYQTRDWDW